MELYLRVMDDWETALLIKKVKKQNKPANPNANQASNGHSDGSSLVVEKKVIKTGSMLSGGFSLSALKANTIKS